jgi:hypothetical protein
MSSATWSITVWTVYVLLLGTVLLVAPNLLLSIFQIDKTDEVWIRIAGLLLIGYGAFYWTAVQVEFTRMYRMSAGVRWGIAAGLIVLAVTVGPWQLVLFALVDLLGGLWTHLALRADSAATVA